MAGTTGYDCATCGISDDPGEQTHKTIDNIEIALSEFGASIADVVQIITNFVHQEDWDKIGSALKERLDCVHPVNAGMRTGPIHPEMRVEISATAVRSNSL